MTVTPEFKGTHLWERLCWAKENLDGVQSDYRVVYEDNVDECAKILVPDPNWMACALQGGILPPVWVYWELAKDEAQPGFKKHTRGYLLHDTEPMGPMTEHQCSVRAYSEHARDTARLGQPTGGALEAMLARAIDQSDLSMFIAACNDCNS